MEEQILRQILDELKVVNKRLDNIEQKIDDIDFNVVCLWEDIKRHDARFSKIESTISG